MAGNATSGFNYAVYGQLYGTQKGAAIFGSISGLGDVGLSEQYAGYFRGNVKCENIIYATEVVETSDGHFKTNIADINAIDAVDNLKKINPVKYNLKQFDIVQTSKDSTSISKFYDETDQLFTKAKYGVIAQDLQQIYPDLVYEDGDGSLAVSYTGLIPILIKVIQSQQIKIEDLEKELQLLNERITEIKLE